MIDLHFTRIPDVLTRKPLSHTHALTKFRVAHNLAGVVRPAKAKPE
jgi:hypothetical protein